ncbi:hypothetical protein ACS0TY_009747 [Phlomoides rotata]
MHLFTNNNTRKIGIEIKRYSQGMVLNQKKYILELLLRAGMKGAKGISIPMITGNHLSKHDGQPLQDAHLYRSIIGGLQYATVSRPDI